MKFNRYLALISAATLCLFTAINAQAKPKRWFEMEVILFSQLGDKSQLKENFSNNTPLPRYRKVRELLSQYLLPDISLLAQHLPQCDSGELKNQTAIELLDKPRLQSPFLTKSIDELSLEMLSEQPELTTSNFTTAQVNQSENQLVNQSANNSEVQPTVIEETIKPVLHSLKENENQVATILSAEEQLLLIEKAELTKKLVAEAEQTFIEQSYQYTPYVVYPGLCQLSDTVIAAIKENDPEFNPYAFELNQVDKTIDAIETPYSDQPYLISAESLQLHDAVKQLKRSKEFKPLLHIGWRQSEPAINKKRSIPMHLFAGENLQAHYQKQLAQYEQDLAKVNAQEAALQQILFTGADEQSSATELTTSLTSEQQSTEMAKKMKIDAIIESLALMPSDQESLISQLDDIKNATAQEPTASLLSPPLAPSQDWTIDGLFNVHLNHYLYITADFNIANMSLAEQASKSLIKGEPQAIESIRFSQNKRVISKEIHYFDHPYIGMIVQIRRHKRPDPALADKQ